MRVAIPEHQGRVAPVFDCCRCVLVVEQCPKQEQLLFAEDWSNVAWFSRAGRLHDLLVELLICGGISCRMEEQIRRRGIRLIPWVVGEVWQVLGAYRTGSISDPQYAMPGRLACMRGRYGQRRGRHGREQHFVRKESHYART
jgi:predicted Fe-Mo cluster-binding NifX family protein